MFRNLDLAAKITLFTVGILILLSATYGIGSSFILDNLLRQKITDEASNLSVNFLADEKAEVQMLSAVSAMIASGQTTMQLFLEKNREGLYQHILPTFVSNQEQFSVNLMEFYLPNRTNFLRMQAKDSYGGKNIHDSLFNRIESTKQETSGFDFESNDLAMRLIVPYMNQNKLIGYIETGESISHLIVELKVRTNDDFAVFLDKSIISKSDLSAIKNSPKVKDFIETQGHIEIANTGKNNVFKNCFNNGVEKKVQIKGATIIEQQLKDNGGKYACAALDIKDIDGKHLGLLLAVLDITPFINATNYNIRIILGSSIIFFIIFFLIINYFIRHQVTNPLMELNELTGEISQGNLDKKIDIKRNDEIGQLATSFNSMVGKLKQSYQNLEQKIKTRTADLDKKNKDAEDRERAILNILEDLDTEKKNLEQANAKDEALLTSIGDGVIATDKNGAVIFMNHAAELLLEEESKQFLGKKLHKVLKSYDAKGTSILPQNRPIQIVLTTKKSITATRAFSYKRKDGTLFPVSITVTPVILNKNLFGTIEIFRDITKEIEIDKAKTEFVSLASHQLRTPLSTVSWYTEMLLAGDAGKLTSTQKKYLGEVYRGNHHMVDLVDSLLNVSRLEMGTFTVEPKLTDLVKLAKDVIEEQKPEIKKRGLVLDETYDENLPKVSVDPKLSHIIFENLLSNAIKYTPTKGKITFTIKKKANNIVISMADTGLGIPKRQQDKIFTKLFRADNVRVKDTEGTGLGLYIVKAIIDHSSGKIWFESEENKGSVFHVSLPLTGMKKKEGTKPLA